MFKDALNFIGFLDEVTDALNRLPTVWNLGALFRLNSLGQGVENIMVGISRGDITRILDGIVDVASAVLPKPMTIFIDLAKFAISVILPLNEEDQIKFMDFRAQCMFRKNADQLSPAEAEQFSERYTNLASIVTIPADYARYNIGGWFGSPQC